MTVEISPACAASYVRSYGSPLYLIFEAILRERYQRLRAAFERFGVRAAIAYSIKTNYLTAVCQIVAEEGAWAEVVSGFEYDIAKRAGVQDRNIVFNGPYKSRDELDLLLGAAIVNVESFDELLCANAIAQQKGFRVPIGIRVNLPAGNIPWSRFGFGLTSGEAEEAVDMTQNLPGVELAGIHAHIGTNIPDADVFADASKAICDFAVSVTRRGVSLRYVDFGGGFASPGAVPLWGGEIPWMVPPVEDYVTALCNPFLASFPHSATRPLLIIEPGRSVVSDAGVVLATVTSKRSLGDRCSIVVDAGVNLVPSAYYLKKEIRNLTQPSRPKRPIDVWGPLCMQVDCLGLDVPLAEPDVGDIIGIFETGAYDFSHSIQFIRLRPAVAMISSDGATRLLRRKEESEDMFRLELS